MVTDCIKSGRSVRDPEAHWEAPSCRHLGKKKWVQDNINRVVVIRLFSSVLSQDLSIIIGDFI